MTAVTQALKTELSNKQDEIETKTEEIDALHANVKDLKLKQNWLLKEKRKKRSFDDRDSDDDDDDDDGSSRSDDVGSFRKQIKPKKKKKKRHHNRHKKKCGMSEYDLLMVQESAANADRVCHMTKEINRLRALTSFKKK